jgi:hypothetical protein
MHNGNAFVGHLSTLMAWMFVVINPSLIPIILGSLATVSDTTYIKSWETDTGVGRLSAGI